MHKIYFACSIRGGRDDAEIYGELVSHIKTRAIVLSEIFADNKLTPEGSSDPSDFIHTRDMSWVTEADAIIAEVTNPSLGVGYEIAKAEEMGKPVLALFRPQNGRKLSAMIEGSPLTDVVTYTDPKEASFAINGFLEYLPVKR